MTTTATPNTPVLDPHMVALDVDGTLTAGAAMTVGSIEIAAVRDAITAGHHVVLASGRSLVGLSPIAAAVGLGSGWLVASNGAVRARIDPATPGRFPVAHVETINGVRQVIEHVLAARPEAWVAVEDVGHGYRVSAAFADSRLDGRQRLVKEARELWEADAPRIAVYGPQVRDLVPELGEFGVHVHDAADDWLDLTPGHLSKASALETVRQELGIPPERTIAVGDGGNDLEMFAWAARSFAMGHASERVKAAATDVTGPLTQHGAATVLRNLTANSIAVVPDAEALHVAGQVSR